MPVAVDGWGREASVSGVGVCVGSCSGGWCVGSSCNMGSWGTGVSVAGSGWLGSMAGLEGSGGVGLYGSLSTAEPYSLRVELDMTSAHLTLCVCMCQCMLEI